MVQTNQPRKGHTMFLDTTQNQIELYSVKSVTTEGGFDCCFKILEKMLSDSAKNLLGENERAVIIKTMQATLLAPLSPYSVTSDISRSPIIDREHLEFNKYILSNEGV